MQDTTFTLELKSHPKNISVIEPYVNQIVEAYGVDTEMYGNILISLTEAVNNAIIHGNDHDEEKSVTVQLKKNDRYLNFSSRSSIIRDASLNFSILSLVVNSLQQSRYPGL